MTLFVSRMTKFSTSDTVNGVSDDNHSEAVLLTSSLLAPS